jgi:hypothetical protein
MAWLSASIKYLAANGVISASASLSRKSSISLRQRRQYLKAKKMKRKMRLQPGLKRENGGCCLNISYLWHQLQPASMWRLISSESMKASINGYQWRIGVMASAVSMAKA